MRQDHQVLAHLHYICMLVEVLEIGQNADLAMKHRLHMKHQRFRVVKIVVKSLILLLYLFVFTILYSTQEFSKLKVCFMKNK